MKKILKNSMIAMLAVLAVSCNVDDVEDRPVVTGIDAPVLEAPEEGNAYVLNPETMDALAERFVWTAANFGEGVVPQYEVQIDFAGDNFDTPATIGTTAGALQFAASHSVLNTALQTLGATPFEISNFEVRVRAHVATQEMFSNPVEMIVTPYTTETPRLWVPGGYQSASGYGDNFTHATAPQLKAVSFGNTAFEGYVYIANDIISTDNGLKFSTQADWNGTNYGSGATANEVSATGGNITANAGYYRVKVDTDALTLNMTQTTWGVVGNATPGGWDNSTPMTYDPATKKWWVVVALTPQTAPDNGWKFRANNAWDINYGDAVLNSTDGKLSEGGSNIGVTTAGTYRIELDLSNPRDYKYTITLQ